MRSKPGIRIVGVLAATALAFVIAPASGSAANKLSFSEARHIGQKKVRQNHCPVVCHSSRVRACIRKRSNKIRCKGRTRYPIGSGTAKRVCSGKVIVIKRSGGRVVVKTPNWSCKTVR